MEDGAAQASLVVLEEGAEPTQFAVKIHFEREAGEDDRKREGEHLASEVSAWHARVPSKGSSMLDVYMYFRSCWPRRKWRRRKMVCWPALRLIAHLRLSQRQ